MRCNRTTDDGRQCVRNLHWFGRHEFVARGLELGPVVEEPDAERLYPFVVRAAAQGRCEAAWTLQPTSGWVCGAGTHDGHIAHALWPADLDAGVYDPARAVWICHAAHEWIVRNPAAARECGLLNPDSHP